MYASACVCVCVYVCVCIVPNDGECSGHDMDQWIRIEPDYDFFFGDDE